MKTQSQLSGTPSYSELSYRLQQKLSGGGELSPHRGFRNVVRRGARSPWHDSIPPGRARVPLPPGRTLWVRSASAPARFAPLHYFFSVAPSAWTVALAPPQIMHKKQKTVGIFSGYAFSLFPIFSNIG